VSAIDLYAVLGVARDASTDEIRAAWKGAVADIDPTDPKLNVFNQAGAVLLDPAKRAKYDAELASADTADAEGSRASGAAGATRPADSPSPLRGSNRPGSPGSAAAAAPAVDLASDKPASRGIPAALLALLALLTLAAMLAAIFAAGPLGRALPARGVPESQQRLVDAADAAEKAAVPVLSYDYRHLAADEKAATARMTPAFRKDYEQTFTLIEQNAPQAEAVVAAKVLGSAIAHSSGKGVDVLLFVDRPTSKKGAKEPVVYRDQVTFSMRLVDGEWLVNDMRTTRPA
jgi:Mce-associated membrane protein